MAIRVEPGSDLVFGVLDAATAVTHVRFQKSGNAPVVRAVSATVNVGAGERLRIPTTGFDVVYPDGDLSRAHMRALVDSYWDGEEFQIDCLTDSTTVVTTTGYSQVTHDGWSISEEADS